MAALMFADKVAVIVASEQSRRTWAITAERAGAAIRAARRQVARHGDVARRGLLSWCGDDAERAILTRALDPSVRVATVVREWSARHSL